jgi:DNA-binding GntR family transcriptional regulator
LVAAIKPLQRPLALGDQVYQTLRGHLRDGAILAGQPLQEVPLAERLGVSRTPVREALMRLASEGLLASDGRSFIVPALTLQDVDDIYEVRFLLEPAALRRVAELPLDDALRAPIDEALTAAGVAFKANDAAAFREANIGFRNAWQNLVPNRRMVRAIEQYADHMMRIRALTLDDAKVRAIVLDGLKRIAKAIAAGDGDGAAKATRDHLGEAKRCFIIATGLDQTDTQSIKESA